DGPRRAIVEIESMHGELAVVALREDVETPDGAVALDAIVPAHPLVLPAHPHPPRIDVAEGELLDAAPALPAPPSSWCGPVPASDEEAILPPAPALAPLLGERERPRAEPPATTTVAEHRAPSHDARALLDAPRIELAAIAEHGRGPIAPSPDARALFGALAAEHARIRSEEHTSEL